MAQTGYTPILIYSSATASQAPSASNLTNSTLGSELAINITDGKLFYKDNGGSVQVIAWKVTPTSAGGTGLTSYTAGDMLYYATGTTLSKLAIGTADYVMTSSGTAPQWSQFLKATAGGTGQTSYAVGDILYASSTTALSKLADVAAGNALISGGVGVAPSWGKIALTTHVSGVLPVANGGTNASSASITAFNNITGYTASGATGTTSTNLVFSTSPSITTATLVGDSTMSTGNLIQGTAAKGINFTANTAAAGMTSQLLNWYEEGTWTPSLGGNTTYTTQIGRYTRIGNMVTVWAQLDINAIGTGDKRTVSGLPFTAANLTVEGTGSVGYSVNLATAVVSLVPQVNANAKTISFMNRTGAATGTTSVDLFQNSARMYFTVSYMAA